MDDNQGMDHADTVVVLSGQELLTNQGANHIPYETTCMILQALQGQLSWLTTLRSSHLLSRCYRIRFLLEDQLMKNLMLISPTS